MRTFQAYGICIADILRLCYVLFFCRMKFPSLFTFKELSYLILLAYKWFLSRLLPSASSMLYQIDSATFRAR